MFILEMFFVPGVGDNQVTLRAAPWLQLKDHMIRLTLEPYLATTLVKSLLLSTV
jgi:hypothetical protein